MLGPLTYLLRSGLGYLFIPTVQGIAKITVSHHKISAAIEKEQNIVIRFEEKQRVLRFVGIQLINDCRGVDARAASYGPGSLFDLVAVEGTSQLIGSWSKCLWVVVKREIPLRFYTFSRDSLLQSLATSAQGLRPTKRRATDESVAPDAGRPDRDLG